MGIDEGEEDGTMLGRREAIKVGSCAVGMSAGVLDAIAAGSCVINEGE